MNTDENINYPRDTLRIFIKEELEHIRMRLALLKGKIREDDFSLLESELNEREEILNILQDDDIQLFLLRREISLLDENVRSLMVKQGWRSKIPISFWPAIIIIPTVMYLVWLTILQR
jgi:hypothetical protein